MPDTITSDELISDARLREMIASANFYYGANGYDPDPSEVVTVLEELLASRDLIARLSADKARMAGDWIEWHGGDCPCPGALVIYKTDNGTPDGWVHAGTHWLAENLNWSGDRGRSQIIAYKIVKPAASPPNMEELREALAYAAMGLGRIHDALTDTSPKQAVGEMTAHFLEQAQTALQNASTTP